MQSKPYLMPIQNLQMSVFSMELQGLEHCEYHRRKIVIITLYLRSLLEEARWTRCFSGWELLPVFGARGWMERQSV